MSSLRTRISDDSDGPYDLPGYPFNMARMPRSQRQTRCERCILSHKPCDGKVPVCSTCSHRQKPLPCIYPEGQPSRSQLEKRKKQEAETARMTKDQQAKNREAAGITYGFGIGRYGTVPDSWPERFGGKGRFVTMADLEIKKSRSAEEIEEAEQRGRKRFRMAKESSSPELIAKHPGLNALYESESEEEPALFDITHRFPCLIGGEPSAGPMEDIAPRAPALGTPFDPTTKPKPSIPPGMTPEEWGRKIINDFEADLPKHQGGLLHGLPDYSNVNFPAPTDPEELNEEKKDVFAVLQNLVKMLTEAVNEAKAITEDGDVGKDK